MQSSETSQQSLPGPSGGGTFSNPLYSAQHAQPGHRSMAIPRSPEQASTSSEYFPQNRLGPEDAGSSSLPYRGSNHGLSSQSSNVTLGHSQAGHRQSITSQLGTSAQAMPSQTSLTHPGMPHSSSVQFSSAPLLGPSSSSASQQAKASFGPGTSRAPQQAQNTLATNLGSDLQQLQFREEDLQAGTSDASQQAQRVQYTEREGAGGRQEEHQHSSSRRTHKLDAGPASSPQVVSAAPLPPLPPPSRALASTIHYDIIENKV